MSDVVMSRCTVGRGRKKVFQMRKTSRFDRPITLRIRVDGLYLCVAMGSPARPFECRAAIFSRFVVNLFVSVPDGSSERKRFLTRCPTPCGRKFVLPQIVGIPANARLRAVSPELVANTIFGCSAPKGCQRRRTDGDAHPERKSPAQAARRPLRRSARTDRSDPHEEPRARPRSLRSDGTETCALTMVPGRTPFCVPLAFPSPNARPAFRAA